MSVFALPYMHDEAAAFERVEEMLWPDGPVCPHCGVVDRAYRLTGVRTKPSKKHPEGKERHGLWKCRDCRKQFTVRKGTIFEESHIELFKWLQAIHLMVSSKKGISSYQLANTLEITQASAWFMAHRIREAMRTDHTGLMGSGGGKVEADETFIGIDPDYKGPRTVYHHKCKVLSLVDRDSGQARNFVIDTLRRDEIEPIIQANVAREAHLMTDEARHYVGIGKAFAAHDSVNHKDGEYGRGEVHTNTVEGYYSIFKRGMMGIYQHCAKRHLHRYASEFEFRYNNRVAHGVNDKARADLALQSIVGKRLTYAGTGA